MKQNKKKENQKREQLFDEWDYRTHEFFIVTFIDGV
jgi:hypothetical protein